MKFATGNIAIGPFESRQIVGPSTSFAPTIFVKPNVMDIAPAIQLADFKTYHCLQIYCALQFGDPIKKRDIEIDVNLVRLPRGPLPPDGFQYEDIKNYVVHTIPLVWSKDLPTFKDVEAGEYQTHELFLVTGLELPCQANDRLLLFLSYSNIYVHQFVLNAKLK
jgi:hypothetical protein